MDILKINNDKNSIFTYELSDNVRTKFFFVIFWLLSLTFDNENVFDVIYKWANLNRLNRADLVSDQESLCDVQR